MVQFREREREREKTDWNSKWVRLFGSSSIPSSATPRCGYTHSLTLFSIFLFFFFFKICAWWSYVLGYGWIRAQFFNLFLLVMPRVVIVVGFVFFFFLFGWFYGIVRISTYYRLLRFLPMVFGEKCIYSESKIPSYYFITKTIAHCPIILDYNYAPCTCFA